MVITPSRNIVAAFDASSNSVYALDTVRETGIGSVHLPGPTSSMTFPTAVGIGYAAIPTATLNGFSVLGAVDVMNFSTSALTTIAVSNAQTVVADSTGIQLLVFSNDSDSVTVLTPGIAVPPVDNSCLSGVNNAVCTTVPGFDRPVNAIVSGTTAYILDCGAECGGGLGGPVQCQNAGAPNSPCVVVLDLGTLTITNAIPVGGATWALLSGTTLYVAGTPPGYACPTSQKTAAPLCGTLDVVDMGSGTVTARVAITDGYHDRMDMTTNGQVFVGSHDCTNIGNVNNPSGEVRGCLSIFKTADNSVIFPPDNGDVTGLQGFVSRNVEYVAEGGALRVYDTNKDILLINDFVPQGTIDIVGYVGDVKA